MDDGLANDLSTADDGINGDEVNVPDEIVDDAANSDDADISDDYLVSYAGDHKSHSSHSKYKTNFADDNKKSDHRALKNSSEKAKPHHKNSLNKHSNATHDKKAKPHHRHHSKPIHDKKAKSHHNHPLEIVQMSDYRPQASHAEIEPALKIYSPDAERTAVRADASGKFADATNHFVEAADHGSGMTKESELCACSDAESCHEDDCPLCAMDDSIDSFTSDEAAYSCSHFYTQINTAGASLVRFQEEDEEELMGERVRSMKGIETFVCSPEANESADNGETSHVNLDICLTDSLYGDTAQFAGIGLDIEDLYSTDLDIKDYNLEYYMFSNPDIIVKANISNLPKTNTPIFNTDFDHCLENSDVKTVPTSYIIFSHDLSRISEDEYATTFLHKAVSLLNNDEINLMLIKASAMELNGPSPINRSNDGSAFASLLNLGGILDG